MFQKQSTHLHDPGRTHTALVTQHQVVQSAQRGTAARAAGSALCSLSPQHWCAQRSMACSPPLCRPQRRFQWGTACMEQSQWHCRSLACTCTLAPSLSYRRLRWQVNSKRVHTFLYFVRTREYRESATRFVSQAGLLSDSSNFYAGRSTTT